MRTVTGAARNVWEPVSRVLKPGTRRRLRHLAARVVSQRRVPELAAPGAGADQGLVDPLWKRWFERRGVDLLDLHK